MKKPSQRVRGILSKMTLEEKANQLSCIMPAMAVEKGVFSKENAMFMKCVDVTDLHQS